MLPHPSLSLLAVAPAASSRAAPLLDYLIRLPHVRLDTAAVLPADLSRYQAAITFGPLNSDALSHLMPFVQAGGGWLACIDATPAGLPVQLGASVHPPGPVTELRVLFEDPEHPLRARLPDAIYVTSTYQALTPVDDHTLIILYADWHYAHTPVMTLRRVEAGQVAATTLQAYDHPVFQQICYRLLRGLAGRPPNAAPLGVGILGYAPSVGRLHALGIGATRGLTLRAVCDLNPSRCEAAHREFPDVRLLTDARDLAGDDGTDLVIVATPPNIHADNCLEMMAAGKHVVCEKPLALNHRETGTMVEMAERQGVHLSCHQNRRWDPDYRTIRDHLQRGCIGELFYMETFVGGFHHPCGYWHSHAPVSGGMTYDWGAHYIDWIVGLIPKPVTAVVGTRHKRVWQDVSNADQERIHIRFEGGVEAEFMHSDIAAAPKPKWYLLGTQGAIVGRWRDVHTHTIDPVHYYHRHEIPATEMEPALTLYRRRAEGEILRIRPPLAPRDLFGFHRNLADHLLLGEPITAPLADSVKVVHILEAAARSMARGGAEERLHGS